MKVYVDDREVTILPGMTVRHAIMAAGLTERLRKALARDAWGNVVGLDGALHEGDRIYVTTKPGAHS